MFSNIGFMIFISTLAVSLQSQLYLSLGSACPLGTKKFGICQLLSRCKTAQAALKAHINPITCSFYNLEPIVCCETGSTGIPTTTPMSTTKKNDLGTNKPKYLQKCLEYENIFERYIEANRPKLDNVPRTTTRRTIFSRRKTTPKMPGYDDLVTQIYFVVGGTKAKEKQFPHMALLGYGDPNQIYWQCGGTLISEQFVMTAGHCLFSSDLGEVRYVRLGDLDLATTFDAAKPQEFDVIERIKHPDYSPPSQYNDIALLRLSRNVQFTEYVLPACLHDTYQIPLFDLTATGWGNTEYGGDRSDYLLFVVLQPYDHSSCNKSYVSSISERRLKYGIVDDTQICAGGKGEEKDTCQGDSGGPLQIRRPTGMYEVVGITSFGKACGIGDSPGIYTRVSAFVPWIETVVWG